MREVASQLTRFGVIGILATAIHAIVYGGLVRFGAALPQLANLVAFMIAFVFSYMGHSRFTFPDKRHSASRTGSRFLAAALFGYVLNAGAVFLTTYVLGWQPAAALFFMVLVTPTAVFLLSKYWAFRVGDKELSKPKTHEP